MNAKKINEAREILNLLGLPKQQQSDLCCYTLLSMCNIDNETEWTNSASNWIRIHEVLEYLRNNFDIHYAENAC